MFEVQLGCLLGCEGQNGFPGQVANEVHGVVMPSGSEGEGSLSASIHRHMLPGGERNVQQLGGPQFPLV